MMNVCVLADNKMYQDLALINLFKPKSVKTK